MFAEVIAFSILEAPHPQIKQMVQTLHMAKGEGVRYIVIPSLGS
jgi:hypothetical protein